MSPWPGAPKTSPTSPSNKSSNWPGIPKSQQSPAINPPSMRAAPALNENSTMADVAHAVKTAFDGLTVHEQAFANLPAQVQAQAAAAASEVIQNISSQTTSGVTAFNSQTGAIIFFPNLSMVNDQLGNPLYLTQNSDAGQKIIVGDSSPVTVTLNPNVTAPWFTFIGNDSSATVSLTTDSGATINGLNSIYPGGFAMVFYDGATFWSEGVGIATDSSLGVVQPDGTTIIIDSGGNISAIPASFTGPLIGDVTGTQGATTVARINGVILPTITAATGVLMDTAGTLSITASPALAVTNMTGAFAAAISHRASLSAIPVSAATNVSGNNGSPNLILQANFWNGSSNANINWTINHAVGSGTTPSSTLQFIPPGGMSSAPVVNFVQLGNANSSSGNFNSPKFAVQGTYWNGASTSYASWAWQLVMGTGTTPTVTLQFVATNAGGGANSVAFPANVVITAGGLTVPLVTKTANYTIAPATDSYIICTTNAFTVTLPTAVGISGRKFIIKNGNPTTNSITLATTSSQTIDATTPGTIAPLAKITVVSDGANWWIVA